MSLRQKFVAITVASLFVGVIDVFLLFHSHLHGYALLPFVIIGAISFYIAWQGFFGIFFPHKETVGDSVGDVIVYLIIGHFLH